jgi:hypothetical protein
MKTFCSTRLAAICLLAALTGNSKMNVEFSAAGGTLAVFIPTNSGLVIAADMRQTPKGIFCDGINKILIAGRPRTAVVVTGYITLQDTNHVPDADLCAFLAKNPAPIDFGRSALDFLKAENRNFDDINGQALTDRIYNDILPYLREGKLRPFFGTRIAQIIIAEYEPGATTSKLLSLGVELDPLGRFQLQPLHVTATTTVRGDSFNMQSSRVVLPFGEVQYFNESVLAGDGKQFLSDEYFELLKRQKVAEIDPTLASTVALNLIEAASKATKIKAAPSGIGGGSSAVLLGTETRVLK